MILEEQRQHSCELVPFSYYECFIPDYFDCVPLHWHKEFEINYILHGQAEFICGEEHFISSPGDIILLPPNMLHAIYKHKDFEHRYDTIVFHPVLLDVATNSRCNIEYIHPLLHGEHTAIIQITPLHHHYNEIKACTETIFFCAKNNSAKYDILLKSMLLQLFWLLEENGYIFQKNDIQPYTSEILRPVIEYINAHFCEDITIPQLAAIAHLSNSYFMELFRQIAGVGAIEYIIQLRIKKACNLLSTQKSHISSIAFECGFHNLSNFNRQFRKFVGCTPKDYRQIQTNHSAPRDKQC